MSFSYSIDLALNGNAHSLVTILFNDNKDSDFIIIIIHSKFDKTSGAEKPHFVFCFCHSQLCPSPLGSWVGSVGPSSRLTCPCQLSHTNPRCDGDDADGCSVLCCGCAHGPLSLEGAIKAYEHQHAHVHTHLAQLAVTGWRVRTGVDTLPETSAAAELHSRHGQKKPQQFSNERWSTSKYFGISE